MAADRTQIMVTQERRRILDRGRTTSNDNPVRVPGEKMIGEGETSLSSAGHPRVVERAMGIKCETVNCAWEESVPGRSWRSTVLLAGRGLKGRARPTPPRGLIRSWTKG